MIKTLDNTQQVDIKLIKDEFHNLKEIIETYIIEMFIIKDDEIFEIKYKEIDTIYPDKEEMKEQYFLIEKIHKSNRFNTIKDIEIYLKEIEKKFWEDYNKI